MGGTYSQDPYAGGGSYTKDPYGDTPGGKVVTTSANKSGGGGVGGFLSHLGSDAVKGVEGLPTGAVDIAKAVGHDIVNPLVHPGPHSAGETAHLFGGVAKQEAHTYAPLVHGNIGQFAHELEQHPLGPILDALTVATLGAGGVAKAGQIASKAGLVSDTGRLATLGKAADLTVPDFGTNERIVVKQTAHQPLAKLRQQAVHAGLNKLPPETPVVGSTARAVRALQRGPAKEAARLDLQAQDAARAFAKLSKPEKAAWHLKARGLTPETYRAFLATQAKTSPAALKLLADPRVSDLVAQPTARLADALGKGRALSERLTASRVQAGHIDELTALEAPYRHLRLVSGAHFEEPTPAKLGTPSAALIRAQSYADRLGARVDREELKQPGENLVPRHMGGAGDTPRVAALRATHSHALEEVQRLTDAAAQHAKPTGLIGGKSVEQLMQEIEAAGGEHPFHVPDTAQVPGVRSPFSSRPAGYAAPAQGVKQSRLVLASQGRINFANNALARDYGRYRNQAAAQMLHDELVKHAAILPRGEQLPRNWDYLPLNRGQAAAPYTERVGAALEHELQPPSLVQRLRAAGQRTELPQTLGEGEQFRLVVPKQVRRLVEDESRSYTSRLAQIRRVPLNVWKGLVLGLRPAFFGNITIGNSILGTLQMAPGRYGFMGWLNQVMPGFEKVAGSKLSAETMREVFPEQAGGTFAGSVSPHGYHGSSRTLRGLSKAAQGVAPATIAYENVLRRAMAEGWANATPAIQDAMRTNGGDVNAALRTVAKQSPQTIDNISRRIDNALGNYRTYNRFERAIKAVVPFYGWNRHVTSSLFRLASERPQLLDAMLNTGLQGKQQADSILGALPSYLEGSIPAKLPSWLGGQQGATTVLNPTSWNPFSTIIDEGRLAANLAGGKAGAASDAYPLAPDVEAAIEQITGRSLLTGAPIKGNAIVDELKNISPQVSLFTRPPAKPGSVNQNRRVATLMRLLGLPVENLNLPAAQAAARKGR